MKRRQFIILVAGAASAWPLRTRAQQAGKPPTIGFVGTNVLIWKPFTAAFVARMQELGWVEGRTIAIEYRWDEGSPERDVQIAEELIRLKVDIIVSVGDAVGAFKKATTTTPIIFAFAQDPVAGGLVPDLARPGGNVTGLSLQQGDLAGKRLALLREVVPSLRRLAVLVNAGSPIIAQEMTEVRAASRTLNLDIVPLEIRQTEDIAPAFEALKSRADALYAVVDALVAINRTQVIALALKARLPMIFNNRVFPQAGALMSYGPNFPDLLRRTADLTDKVLRGTKPGDIPVEQPTKFELVFNLKTAKALGLTIPQTLLATADEVIE